MRIERFLLETLLFYDLELYIPILALTRKEEEELDDKIEVVDIEVYLKSHKKDRDSVAPLDKEFLLDYIVCRLSHLFLTSEEELEARSLIKFLLISNSKF